MYVGQLFVVLNEMVVKCTCAVGGWCSVPLRPHYADNHVTVRDGQAVFEFLALQPEEVA